MGDGRWAMADGRWPMADTRYPIRDIRYLISDTRYPIPDTRYPIPDLRPAIPTRDPRPATRVGAAGVGFCDGVDESGRAARPAEASLQGVGRLGRDRRGRSDLRSRRGAHV